MSKLKIKQGWLPLLNMVASAVLEKGPITPRPKARFSDPLTSHLAANGVTRRILTEVVDTIITVLTAQDAFRSTEDGLTDEDIIRKVRQLHVISSDSGIRTRRHELVDAGLVVPGRITTNERGRKVYTWRLRRNLTPLEQETQTYWRVEDDVTAED